MKRALAIGVVLVASVVVLGSVSSSGDSGAYKVRAIFDNAGFVVKGEEVRIAGAKVGQVESVGLTMPGDTASEEGGPHAEPGKAVVVMSIDDPGFRDFRADASCLIRPQSLIGEKFIECTPTQPRASGSAPPPPLATIPSGQAGAGQHLLPVEQNGKAVDLDLIQNVMRRPFADRFRLVLNELGAGFAARGKDLAEIVDRANPALRQTDRVLAILAQQNQDLASLAQNGDTSLAPLARERRHITGFFRGANTTNEAVLERQPQFEAGLQRLPKALDEIHGTMTSLRGLTDQGTPLFTSLNSSATDFSKATQKLGPFATSAIPALKTLGDAGQAAGPKLVAADPVVVKLGGLANSSVSPATNLASLLSTFNQTNGFKYLMDFIYNTTGSQNGYDSFGHFLRANLQITGCLDYQTIVYSGCEAFFHSTTATKKKCQQKNKKKRKKCQQKNKKKKKKGKAKSAGLRSAAPPATVPGASAVDATGAAAPEAQSDPVPPEDGARMLQFLFGDGGEGK
jgi:phospholipid/cholesterol/gamma-HCH transport system substrate-binding protein